MIGTAFLAVLMCVNLAACGGNDDDDEINNNENGEINNGSGNEDDDNGSSNNGNGDSNGEKRLTKIYGIHHYIDSVYTEKYTEKYTFSYDNEGKLSVAVAEIFWESMDGGGNISDEQDIETYTFTWGDNVIKVKEVRDYQYGGTYEEENMFYLSNGLVQFSDNDEAFTYDESKRIIKAEEGYRTMVATWNGDKLLSTQSNEDGGSTAKLTYNNNSCKKGYFPFISSIIDFGCEILFMAHPEIAGMRTNQLPASLEHSNAMYEEEYSYTTITYEFDEDGYISKINCDNAMTYTLIWE